VRGSQRPDQGKPPYLHPDRKAIRDGGATREERGQGNSIPERLFVTEKGKGVFSWGSKAFAEMPSERKGKSAEAEKRSDLEEKKRMPFLR